MELGVSTHFICNKDLVTTSLHPATTVLDFIRKHLHLTGTKEACREGDCGACTILIGELNNGQVKYHSSNSCLLPLGKINGKHIVTIEGLNHIQLNPIQNAMVEEGGTQCGFCTPGFIISMTAYFLNAQKFRIEDLLNSLDGNICRCSGYIGIQRAATSVLNLINESTNQNYIENLVKQKILPEYFLQIPRRLKELDEISGSTKGSTKEAIIISGGTDLFVQKWDDMLDYEVKFFPEKRPSNLIWIENNRCFIHASATISDIKNSPIIKIYFPKIENYFKHFGSLPIRNSATVGGNIVNASPIGDSIIFFLALNSKINLRSENSTREIFLRDFFKGYKKIDIAKNEIMESLSFSLPSGNFFFNFEKVSKRTNLDIASVNSAIFILVSEDKISNIAISAGGVSPIPMLLKKTSEFLTNKEITSENILDAVSLASTEISPIDDVRGSAEYKVLLLRQIIFSHFLKLFPELIKVEALI
jgi:xanthine dehydrogenase small subunit